MTFSEALVLCKQGYHISREGWNGKEQYVELAQDITYKNLDGDTIHANHQDSGSQCLAFHGTHGVQLGWLASQSDLLADDWKINTTANSAREDMKLLFSAAHSIIDMITRCYPNVDEAFPKFDPRALYTIARKDLYHHTDFHVYPAYPNPYKLYLDRTSVEGACKVLNDQRDSEYIYCPVSLNLTNDSMIIEII